MTAWVPSTRQVVAAIDVGNSTTEVLLARLSPSGIDVVAAGRRPTRRAKGSPESLGGAASLVRRLERQRDVWVVEALAAPLRPVLSTRATVPLATPDTGRLRVVGLGARTVGAPGFGAGPAVLLERGAPVRLDAAAPVVVVVPSAIGYAEAAALLREAVVRGEVAAVLVEADEAALVANRLPSAPSGPVPVLDEIPVDDVVGADRVAVEVAPPARSLRTLTDPLRLADALSLDDEAAGAGARVAAQLYDAPHAVVLVGNDREVGAKPTGWASVAGERVALPVAHEVVRTGLVGAVDGYAPPGTADGFAVDDLWTVDLTEVRGRVRARPGVAGTTALGVAALAAGDALVDPAEALSSALQVPVRVGGTEALAARLGALSTPRSPEDAVVVDLGGGTIDVVTHDRAVVAAGAGDLLTLCVAGLTGASAAASEWVKRGPSRRAEGPQVLLGEDGRRTFLDRPLPAPVLGSLVVDGPAGWLGFAPDLAPAEWRALRLDLKRDLIGGNVARALRSLDRPLTGTVLLVGGAAADDEAVAAVAAALPAEAVVARGNVAGRFGHQYAAAYGLLPQLLP